MEALENIVWQRSVKILRHGIHAAVYAQAAGVLGVERDELCNGFTGAGNLDLLTAVDEPQQLRQASLRLVDADPDRSGLSHGLSLVRFSGRPRAKLPMLSLKPLGTTDRSGSFPGEPVFDHDFDHVDYDVTEFDERVGTPGLHTVRGTVQAEPRESLLPPDLFKRFRNAAFWRDPQRILPGCRSCEISSSVARTGVALRHHGSRRPTTIRALCGW